jgi:hypothetical protein
MKLRKKFGSNVTELEFDDGTRVLFSYETPCAAYVPRSCGETPGGWWKLNRHVSRATAAHVKDWLKMGHVDRRLDARPVPASAFAELLADITGRPEPECDGCSDRQKFLSTAYVDGHRLTMCTACFDEDKRAGKHVSMTAPRQEEAGD